ncbi:MAG: acetolactate synthase large subunit, partial [Sneathiella sp.]|nr:acetolactate synthase large subunit [Sneathiella sp.]
MTITTPMSDEVANKKTTKASDLFVQALEAEGVEYVFAVPGEENLDMVESLRTSNIKLILNRHEQGAGFMAATYGRLTGKAG